MENIRNKALFGILISLIRKMIWIPKAKRMEMIKETHKMLAHAGADKVLHYIGNAYDMAKMKNMVKETINKVIINFNV